MFLRILLASCIEISDMSVSENDTHPIINRAKCLRTLVIKLFLRVLVASYIENNVIL